MTRLALVLPCALFGATLAFPNEPTPVEKQLAVQSAMASARKYLDSQMPTEAVAALEKEVSNADGNKAFLALLREAYLAELYRLEKAPTADPEHLAKTRRKLLLVGGPEPKPAEAPNPLPEPNLGPSLVAPVVTPDKGPPAFPINQPDGRPTSKTPPPVTAKEPFRPAPPMSALEEVNEPPAGFALEHAIAAFKAGNYAQADEWFTGIGAKNLTANQKTAWAYCRIKLAADRVNAPNCDPATAAAAAQSVSDALELISDNAKLLAFGREVLKAAQAKAGRAGGVAAPVVVTGDIVESASFRVSGGTRELAEQVAKAAETARRQIFERWSGPPGGAWQPKCEIVLHATADAYAKATGKPAALTGHATVTLANARATARRIDLRTDDPAVLTNALPRELTHVVLADLFADKPPPKWAAEGMAVLAGSPEEIGRYTRTLARCARDGELRTMAALFDLKDFPADKITGFCCQSVSVTEYLIKLNGERNFKIFLSDAQRYGPAQALKRQYNIDGPQGLEAAWKRACVDQARGQAP